MKDYRAEKNLVLSAVREYQGLKDIFKSFAEIVKEALPENNDYRVTFLGSSDTTINLMAFDKSVDILFSFVNRKNDEIYGRLDFVHTGNKDNREHILILYFDCDGEFSEDISERGRIASLNNKYLGDYVLTLLLKKYITLPRFREASNNNSGK